MTHVTRSPGTTFPAEHLSTSINRPPDHVYEFALHPQNWPQWAAGLGSGLRQNGDHWIATSPAGDLKVTFTAKNDFGILDHTVELPSGLNVYNPLRVFANGQGSEVVFTLYQRPDMTDQQYAADAAAVKKDLATLKELLES